MDQYAYTFVCEGGGVIDPNTEDVRENDAVGAGDTVCCEPTRASSLKPQEAFPS